MAPGDGRRAPSGGRATSLLWWLLVLRSVLVLGLGVAFLVSGTNRPLLGNILAVYWLMGALLTLRWARTNRGASGSRLALVAGVIGVAAAVVLLARSLLQGVISLDAALTLLGVTAVLTGTLRIVGAFHDEQAEGRSRTVRRIALGASEIGIGVIWIAIENVTQAVVRAAGLWALVFGTIMLLDALASRRQARVQEGK